MADELESESAVALLEFKNGRKMSDDNMKEEILSDDEDMDVDEELELGPAALGLQRVGTPINKPTPTQPTQVLNARGMPARIRKKNKLFYDDELVNIPHHRVPSAKKQKHSPTKKYHKSPYKLRREVKSYDLRERKHEKSPRPTSPTPLHSPDRKIGQKIGLRLRNLLKLPKAHKWVCYEWFYSNIDRCLFSGDNDFTICLKESFPELKTRELSRIEWTKIRRMMGRPRRCSQAFFNQERLDLEKKRNKIRALQQRKVTDTSTFQDLPPEIPMQLVIGTKVTARLRKPQDGLFTGSIDAVDTSNNTYRITFERAGLGTHSVPDYEVLSNEPPETMPLNQNKVRRNGNTTTLKSPMKLKKDPLLSGLILNKPQLPGVVTSRGYPVKLLQHMVYVKKILATKRVKIKLLQNMNSEAENYNTFNKDIPEDFERRYAGILIELEQLNTDLQYYLKEMQDQCQEIAPEHSLSSIVAPDQLREKCREEAAEIVMRNNSAMSDRPVANEKILDLVTDLTGLMIQVKCLSDSDQDPYKLQVIEGTMEDIKRKLSASNQTVFQTNVEIHMKHIEIGLGQVSKAIK
ncbi:PREDICTED: protein lin-9 homolog [Nicrophorus vespilloides]|uniref:Protein lin-9 homolog n=1 Tax=Nicrophorus vespilloides TaxID=110193 RepID=A0ABM1MZI8_NICVS|nr:PREDICTED: protein lin-9 homolog [Nicrophorus vespilloides]